MKIVIIGAGTVGAAICEQLADENHDVTLVDKDYAVLSEASTKYDAFGVVGNGADMAVLRDAGVEKADLIIAVTSGDEVNILCCAAAKKLGAKHAVARVRNPEYSELMSFMKQDMNLSFTINPELAVAKEIYRMLRFPSATKIDSFCRGRVELAEFVVEDSSPLCGTTLFDLRAKTNLRFLICAVLRDGIAHIPTGFFKIEAGDRICFTAPDEEIPRFFKAINAYKHPVRDVLIVGGGRTTYYLLDMLKDGKINATVIERDKTRCHELAEQYNCTVLCDDGTKESVLLEEGIDRKDAFLALSDTDEENTIVSMYAKTRNTSKIVTMIRSISFLELFKGIGLDSIVSPKSSTATYILRYVRALANVRDSEIESLYRLMDDKVEALEFLVKEPISSLTDIPLKELKLRPGILVACIVHNNEIVIPMGDDMITSGDTVIIVTTETQIKGLKEILK